MVRHSYARSPTAGELRARSFGLSPQTNPRRSIRSASTFALSFTGAARQSGLACNRYPGRRLSSFYPTLPAQLRRARPFPSSRHSSMSRTTPTGTLFTVSLCQTILLFPYVTDFYGFDTGIAISNTSIDPLGAIGRNAPTGSMLRELLRDRRLTSAPAAPIVRLADTTLTTGSIPSWPTWAVLVCPVSILVTTARPPTGLPDTPSRFANSSMLTVTPS